MAAAKLDMSKPYDRVEGRFLEVIMLKMGFHPMWVERLVDCVTIVSFYVFINGNPSFFFLPTSWAEARRSLVPVPVYFMCSKFVFSI